MAPAMVSAPEDEGHKQAKGGKGRWFLQVREGGHARPLWWQGADESGARVSIEYIETRHVGPFGRERRNGCGLDIDSLDTGEGAPFHRE